MDYERLSGDDLEDLAREDGWDSLFNIFHNKEGRQEGSWKDSLLPVIWYGIVILAVVAIATFAPTPTQR